MKAKRPGFTAGQVPKGTGRLRSRGTVSSVDGVMIYEAWYMCPEHGSQHHPAGANLDVPCPHCSTSAKP